MTGIWKNTIGYDPYAGEDEKTEDVEKRQEQAQGLMLLARMSNVSGAETRGACKRCGMVGHLTFQCRNDANPTKAGDESDSDSDDSAVEEEAKVEVRESTRSSSDKKSSRRDRSRSRDRATSRRSASPSDRKRSKKDKKHKSKKHKSSDKKSKKDRR